MSKTQIARSFEERKSVYLNVIKKEAGQLLSSSIVGQNDIIIPTIMQEMGYTNTFQVPRLHKIIVSIGPKGSVPMGKAGDNAAKSGQVSKEDAKNAGEDNSKKSGLLKQMEEHIKDITGMNPVVTRIRKEGGSSKAQRNASIAGVRKKGGSSGLRKGDYAGVKVSLTGKNMYNFFNKFKYTLLNYRDFEAISMKSINQTANSCQMNIGLKNLAYNTEVKYLGSSMIIGATVTIVSKLGTHTITDKKAFALFLYYAGLPIREIIEGVI